MQAQSHKEYNKELLIKIMEPFTSEMVYIYDQYIKSSGF
jgi:hypothetical protein